MPGHLALTMSNLPSALTWKMGSHPGEAPSTLRSGLALAGSFKPLLSTARGASPSYTALTVTTNSHPRPCLGTPLWLVICESSWWHDTSLFFPPSLDPPFSTPPSSGHLSWALKFK